MPSLLAADMSDHHVACMAFKDPVSSDKIIEGHYRVSQQLLKQLGNIHSKVHKTTVEYLRIAREHCEKLTEQGCEFPAQQAYDFFKREIIEGVYKKTDHAHKRHRQLLLLKAQEVLNLEEKTMNMTQSEKQDYATEKHKALKYLENQNRIAMQSYRAKSDFNFIREGEHSNKLFFQMMKAREAQNKIPHLRKSDGELTQNPLNRPLCQAGRYTTT